MEDLMSKLIAFLKKLPVDVGQGKKSHTSAGKRIAFSFVPDGQGKSAVDIGCRDGYWVARLKEKGYRVIAFDMAPQYANAVMCDVEASLPFPVNTFDFLWCSEVIEHLSDPERFLRDAERMTKSEGRILLTTPNSRRWFYWITGLFGLGPQELQNSDHKQFLNESSIRVLVKDDSEYGYFPYAVKFFRIQRLVGVLSPTFILVQQP